MKEKKIANGLRKKRQKGKRALLDVSLSASSISESIQEKK